MEYEYFFFATAMCAAADSKIDPDRKRNCIYIIYPKAEAANVAIRWTSLYFIF